MFESTLESYLLAFYDLFGRRLSALVERALEQLVRDDNRVEGLAARSSTLSPVLRDFVLAHASDLGSYGSSRKSVHHCF